jgi:hypothetical protein
MNFVVSTALMLQGDEMLHGTVVETGDRTIGLLGHSGAGKSTLAARLLAGGGSLVTDDTLRLSFKDGRPLAYPGPMRLKLFDEPARRYMPGVSRDGTFNAVSGKYMIAPPSDAVLARQARQVAALFWIEHPEAGPEPAEISVTRLAGAELARCLVASTMNGRYNVPERLARQFRFAEQVGRVMPVFMLRYPRTFDVMDRLVREIAKATDIRETAP